MHLCKFCELYNVCFGTFNAFMMAMTITVQGYFLQSNFYIMHEAGI